MGGKHCLMSVLKRRHMRCLYTGRVRMWALQVLHFLNLSVCSSADVREVQADNTRRLQLLRAFICPHL